MKRSARRVAASRWFCASPIARCQSFRVRTAFFRPPLFRVAQRGRCLRFADALLARFTRLDTVYVMTMPRRAMPATMRAAMPQARSAALRWLRASRVHGAREWRTTHHVVPMPTRESSAYE